MDARNNDFDFDFTPMAQAERRELELIRNNMNQYLDIPAEKSDLQHGPTPTHEI